jgi:hypothetical protein
MPQGDLHRRLAVERRHAGEALVRHGAEGVDVGRRRDRFAGDLLGRHVQHRSGHGVRGGDRRDVGRPRDAEVDQDDRAVLLDEQVAGLHVAVDHPAGVGGVERVGGLGDHRERVEHRQAAGGGNAVRERFAGDVGHHQVRRRTALDAALTEVVHVDHVRVMERGQDACLGPEPGHEAGIGQQRRQQHLDGDGATEHDVGGPPHLAHAAAGEEGVEAVAVAEEFSGTQHIVPLPHPAEGYAHAARLTSLGFEACGSSSRVGTERSRCWWSGRWPGAATPSPA